MDLGRFIIHGCLVKIDGRGVLIVGESGSGKTTICLELAKRGHTFIADDSVEIESITGKFTGCSPIATHGKVAIRKNGIVDIKQKDDYGTLSDCVSINLIVNLSASNETDLRSQIFFGEISKHSLRAKDAMSSADIIEQLTASHGK